jgi:hypothetical protein
MLRMLHCFCVDFLCLTALSRISKYFGQTMYQRKLHLFLLHSLLGSSLLLPSRRGNIKRLQSSRPTARNISHTDYYALITPDSTGHFLLTTVNGLQFQYVNVYYVANI